MREEDGVRGAGSREEWICTEGSDSEPEDGVRGLEFPLPMANSDALLEISSLFCFLFIYIYF